MKHSRHKHAVAHRHLQVLAGWVETIAELVKAWAGI